MTDIIHRLRNTAVPTVELCEEAANEIEKLAGIAAFSSPDMVKWLTDQVMRRDNVIEAMKSAGMEQITKAFTENRWIPVAERLPNEEQEVLAFWPSSGPDDDEPWISVARIYEGDKWRDMEMELQSPTHWQPLPGPPPSAT